MDLVVVVGGERGPPRSSAMRSRRSAAARGGPRPGRLPVGRRWSVSACGTDPPTATGPRGASRGSAVPVLMTKLIGITVVRMSPPHFFLVGAPRRAPPPCTPPSRPTRSCTSARSRNRGSSSATGAPPTGSAGRRRPQRPGSGCGGATGTKPCSTPPPPARSAASPPPSTSTTAAPTCASPSGCPTPGWWPSCATRRPGLLELDAPWSDGLEPEADFARALSLEDERVAEVRPVLALPAPRPLRGGQLEHLGQLFPRGADPRPALPRPRRPPGADPRRHRRLPRRGAHPLAPPAPENVEALRRRHGAAERSHVSCGPAPPPEPTSAPRLARGWPTPPRRAARRRRHPAQCSIPPSAGSSSPPTSTTSPCSSRSPARRTRTGSATRVEGRSSTSGAQVLDAVSDRSVAG